MKIITKNLVAAVLIGSTALVGCGGSGSAPAGESADKQGIKVDGKSVQVGPISVQKDGKGGSSVTMPGLSVTSQDGKSSVSMPGMSVDQSSDGGAKVNVGDVKVDVSADGKSSVVEVGGIKISTDGDQNNIDMGEIKIDMDDAQDETGTPDEVPAEGE